MASLKEIFSDTMNEYQRNLLTTALESAIKMRLFPPKFKENGDGRYVSDPIEDFYGDCDTCKYFECNMGGLSAGIGWCNLHSEYDGCGYGITCKDHIFTEASLYDVENLEAELDKKDGEPL